MPGIRWDGAASRISDIATLIVFRTHTGTVAAATAASLTQQLDAWVWFDETSAVVPPRPEHAHLEGIPVREGDSHWTAVQ